MQTAEVVIIGGGIVGSSIAYHLTAAECKSVLVIERKSAQGKGSTGKSIGGVRPQGRSLETAAYLPKRNGVLRTLPSRGPQNQKSRSLTHG